MIDFKLRRKLDNFRLGVLMVYTCIKYDLRMMQLVEILNKGEDYFNEEPGKTIDRMKADKVLRFLRS